MVRRLTAPCRSWRSGTCGCTSPCAKACSAAGEGRCRPSTASRSDWTEGRSSAWWANRAAARRRWAGPWWGWRPFSRARSVSPGESVIGLTGVAARERARHIQLIFQDPYASLHPRKTVRDLVGAGLRLHGLARGYEIDERVLAILEEVGLGLDHLYRYAHEFSGGQRQRIALARALVLHPELLILDEPTSALDVSVQAQILNLLKDLRREFDLTYLFISHNLGVVRYMSQRIGVMYLGHLVEVGATDALFRRPQHPYSRVLLSALPSLDPDAPTRRQVLAGDPPTPINPPPGCPFAPRCPEAQAFCSREKPALVPRGSDPAHLCACHFPMTNDQ